MEARAVQQEDYLPPLPPRPPKQHHNDNVWQNFSNLWTKIPAQLQGPVKVILVVLGCVLALVIAGLIGYDAAKSRYQETVIGEEASAPASPGGGCHRARPDPLDCSSYFRCEGGVARHAHCPDHHHFDMYKLSCVWIHQSDCGKSPSSSTSPSLPQSPSLPSLPPSLAQVEAEEARLSGQGEIRQLRARLATLPSLQVELVRPGRAVNPANTRLVERILSQEDWDFLFPQRHPAYTYTNFLKAVSKFPAVCHPDSPERCREVLATMFAHFTQETGGHNPSGEVPEWRQGLHYVEELGCDGARDCGYSTNCAGGEWTGKAWPCGQLDAGEWQRYHGRGAKQLSYNYNYGQFSAAMYNGNIRPLLDQPDLVKETWLNLASAIWFFATPQPPKPSMLAVIEQDWLPTSTDKLRGLRAGFGLTTNIINGGIECGKGAETQQALNRAGYYREFAGYLGVQVKGELGCGRMKQFSDSGAVGVYWEQDWASNYKCKLVTYQTPFSALIPGDYIKCVRDKFKLDI